MRSTLVTISIGTSDSESSARNQPAVFAIVRVLPGQQHQAPRLNCAHNHPAQTRRGTASHSAMCTERRTSRTAWVCAARSSAASARATAPVRPREAPNVDQPEHRHGQARRGQLPADAQPRDEDHVESHRLAICNMLGKRQRHREPQGGRRARRERERERRWPWARGDRGAGLGRKANPCSSNRGGRAAGKDRQECSMRWGMMRFAVLGLIGALSACGGQKAGRPRHHCRRRCPSPRRSMHRRPPSAVPLVPHGRGRAEHHRSEPARHRRQACRRRRRLYLFERAFKASGLTWDERRSTPGFASPSKPVPGNKMIFAGQSNPAKRKEIIDYLSARQK